MYRVMAALALIEIVGALENSMVVAVVPAVAKEYKDVGLAGWLITAYGLSAAATAAVAGRLGDLFGRRRLLIIVAAFTALGSLISALAPSIGWIIFGRVVQGLSGAILPLSYGIVRAVVPAVRAPFWMGVLTGGYSFSAIFGYIIGGMFADMGNWSALFFVTAALSLLAIPPLMAFVPRMASPRKDDGKLDILGAVLFAPGIAVILFGVTMVRRWGWASHLTWATIGAGVGMVVFWAWYEARHHNPLFDVRLLRRRKVLIGNLCTCLSGVGMMNLPLVFLMLLQQDPLVAGIGLGVSATLAGVLKIPSNISSIVAAPLAGWMAGRHGARWSAFAGGLIGALSWTGMALAHDTIWLVMLWGVCCAFGSNILLTALPVLVLEGSPPARSSEAAGFAQTVRWVTVAMGGQLIALLLSSSVVVDPKTQAHVPTPEAYGYAFVFIGASALLSALLALLAGRRQDPAGDPA
jgi:MFS family permease